MIKNSSIVYMELVNDSLKKKLADMRSERKRRRTHLISAALERIAVMICARPDWYDSDLIDEIRSDEGNDFIADFIDNIVKDIDLPSKEDAIRLGHEIGRAIAENFKREPADAKQSDDNANPSHAAASKKATIMVGDIEITVKKDKNGTTYTIRTPGGVQVEYHALELCTRAIETMTEDTTIRPYLTDLINDLFG